MPDDRTRTCYIQTGLWKCCAFWSKCAFNSDISNGATFGGSPNNATAALRPSAHQAHPHCDHQHFTPSLIAIISTSRPPSLRPSAHHALPHCDHQHITPSLIATISTSRPPSLRPSAHHALPHCDHQHITPSLIATISTSRPPSLRPSAHHAHPHCDHQHITPSLIALHWLPDRWRINYKILLLTYCALHDLMPAYIVDIISPYTPACRLRSAGSILLTVPRHDIQQ